MNLAHAPISPLVFLLSDFGWQDPYVGVMKAAFYAETLAQGGAPETPLVDLSHDVAPHQIAHGAWTLGYALATLPPGAITLAVVDPGVGDPRQASLVAYWPARRQAFIAPDNGVLTPVLRLAGDALHCAALAPLSQSVCQTFHGRDRYAPAAARLALAMRDGALEAFWRQETQALNAAPVRLPEDPPHRAPDGPDGGWMLRGRVVHIDRFGNALTNLPQTWLVGETASIQLGDRRYEALVTPFYAAKELVNEPFDACRTDGQGDDLRVLASSAGTIEICRFGASAADTLGVALSDPVGMALRQR